MIHGWGMNSGAWETIREALEEDFFMHWVDLPGYGENSRVVAHNIDEIIEYIIPHIPHGVHLVGWSLGGIVAQAIVERLDNDIDKSASKQSHPFIKTLTLVASSPKFSQADDWQNAVSLEVLDNFSTMLNEDIEGTLKRFVALQFMGIKGTRTLQQKIMRDILDMTQGKTASPNNGDIIELSVSKSKTASSLKTGGGVLSQGKTGETGGGVLSQDKTGEIGGGVLPQGSEYLLQQNPAEQLYHSLQTGLTVLKQADYRQSNTAIPQHWILGEHDRLIPPQLINDLKSQRPNAQITLLENTGHAPFMTHPKEFLACMMPFIKNHR